MSEVSHCPTCGAELSPGKAGEPCPACLMKLAFEGGTFVGPSGEPATERYTFGFAAPSVESLAPRLPQFELLELVGKGGMGAVYRARQKSLDRIVAVKIINPQAARQPGFAERFAREARAMARLNHANIVTIHDFGQTSAVAESSVLSETSQDPLFYLVMEYVDGTNLRAVLRDKHLTAAEALQIVPHLCDALQYAHEEGIVHRDIKPENILIDNKSRVKIADFGLAKLLGQTPREMTLTESHHALGTLHYMAPEQLERPLEVDHRADIYALGVTFYEMLTGELPIGRFALPSEKVHVDVRLDEIVLRALEREPARRYQHASDVKTDVQSCATGEPRAPVKASASALAAGSAPRMLIVMLSMIAATLLAIAGVGLLTYAVLHYSADDAETWSWIVGGGMGSLIGGLFGAVSGWNHLRVSHGKTDFANDPHWNSYDSLLLVYGLLGAGGLAATAVWWTSLNLWPRVAALVFGGCAALQGLGMSAWRIAMRHAAKRGRGQSSASLQMLLVATGLFACALLVVGGVVLFAYSVLSLPVGSPKYWAGIGAALTWLFAGSGGVLVTWNLFRALEGLPNWMTEVKRNRLDGFIIFATTCGVLVLLTGILAAPWVTRTSSYALLIIGGVLTVVAGISLAARSLMRRSALENIVKKS